MYKQFSLTVHLSGEFYTILGRDGCSPAGSDTRINRQSIKNGPFSVTPYLLLVIAISHLSLSPCN